MRSLVAVLVKVADVAARSIDTPQVQESAAGFCDARQPVLGGFGAPPYGPSRGGSEALSGVMAADLRSTGVTVNVLLPGG
jgi:NAD(P)-dependent dehydrogenase (short-subunit alcohol dehydrogenase family)